MKKVIDWTKNTNEEKNKFIHEIVFKEKVEKVPDYVNDDALAVRLMNKLRDECLFFDIYPTVDCFNISYDFGRYVVTGETFAEAITLGVLRTLEVEVLGVYDTINENIMDIDKMAKEFESIMEEWK